MRTDLTVHVSPKFRQLLLGALAIAALTVLTDTSSLLHAQQSPTAQPPAAAQKKPDNSQEPLIVESLVTRARYEDDGTGRIESTTRIRVQNDEGVRALDELVFAYNSATERMEISHVRIHHADGTTIEAPSASILDLAAQAVRDAPLYSDAREKHIRVPPLHPGEALEYEVLETIHQPLIRGQFWFQQDFEKTAITLEQKLQLDVPAARALKLKTRPGFEPHVEESSGRRIYTWTTSHTSHTEDAKDQQNSAAGGDAPDVQATTFASWEQLGAWYQSLLHAATAVTPEIQKKADELTANCNTPAEKLNAIYDFVALKLHSVGVAFGSGSYEPHSLSALLKNGYADSIDKHALFAALAAAEGLHVDAVLISSQRASSGSEKLDPDIPSPAAFDRVITRTQDGDKADWLDTITEVAPFGLLTSALRGRQALDIPAEGPATIVETPPDPPFPVHQLWRMEGSISDLGKLDATVHYTLRGDNEVLLRGAFHRTAQAKWKQLGQAIAASDGLRGEITDVKPSDPGDTHHPFTLEYHIVESGFFDWANRRAQLAPPLPALALPDSPAAGAAIVLGSPAEVTMEMRLTIPQHYTARAPVATSVSREYGEYRSTYSAAGGSLSASRTLNIRKHDIPAASANDYTMLFRNAVRNDESQSFVLESTVGGISAIPESAPVDDLVQAATHAYAEQKFPLAEQLLERAVAREPAHKRAWKLLGAVRLAQQENEKAIQAFRKQTEIDPKDEFAYEGIGLAEAAMQHYDEAIAAFRKQIEVKPLDAMAQASLGATLEQAHRWAEAETELEKAVALSSTDPRLYINLGRAELNLNHPDKAKAAFAKAVELNPSPPVWNAAAVELIDHGVDLESAQQYAGLAVAGVESDLANLTIDKISPRDLARVASLATYLDTLGWACFQRGELKRAAKLVDAAWRLSLRGQAGDRLGQIYEKEGRTQEAARMYALAASAAHSPAETRARLEKLVGGTKQADDLIVHVREDPSLFGEHSLPRLLPAGASGSAEFLVLLGTEASPVAVKFLRGDSSLRAAADKIRELALGPAVPDESPAKVPRLGRLACAAQGQACTFSFFPADQVRAAD
ncbi:MAG TPA: DUF3857 domain-containing protein [Patescibacteria group bacterium]|nr:DUF3857 domain-containing protein [Patescibacteria group bacterium]